MNGVKKSRKVHTSKIKMRYNHNKKGVEAQKPIEADFA